MSSFDTWPELVEHTRELVDSSVDRERAVESIIRHAEEDGLRIPRRAVLRIGAEAMVDEALREVYEGRR